MCPVKTILVLVSLSLALFQNYSAHAQGSWEELPADIKREIARYYLNTEDGMRLSQTNRATRAALSTVIYKPSPAVLKLLEGIRGIEYPSKKKRHMIWKKKYLDQCLKAVQDLINLLESNLSVANQIEELSSNHQAFLYTVLSNAISRKLQPFLAYSGTDQSMTERDDEVANLILRHLPRDDQPSTLHHFFQFALSRSLILHSTNLILTGNSDIDFNALRNIFWHVLQPQYLKLDNDMKRGKTGRSVIVRESLDLVDGITHRRDLNSFILLKLLSLFSSNVLDFNFMVSRMKEQRIWENITVAIQERTAVEELIEYCLTKSNTVIELSQRGETRHPDPMEQVKSILKPGQW